MLEITTREEAQEQGLKFYFTGMPCKNGHIAERYTAFNACKECKATNNAKSAQSGLSNHRRSVAAEDDGRSLSVYRLVNDIDQRYYIGSTTLRLHIRLSNHRSSARRRETKGRIYQAMREIGLDKWRIEGIALFPIRIDEDIAFGRSYEAARIAACMNDPHCLNAKFEPNPLPIDNAEQP